MNYAEKLEAAISWLGPKWVLHPERRVQKGNYEQRVLRCDVAATFKRVQKQLAKEPSDSQA